MVNFHARVLTAALMSALVGCAPTATSNRPGPDAASSGLTRGPTSSSPFTAAFADVSERPVTEETAAKLQAGLRSMYERQVALSGMSGRGGMSATVMSPAGTWSGTIGKADGVRDVVVNDQFAIGSVTKSIVAAQVMKLVEAGALDLDDPATDHLPKNLPFNSNSATVRQLLGMRSGIPDYWPLLERRLSTERMRVWTTADLLRLVPAARTPAGRAFDYSNTNYVLLELVIEQVTGRKVVQVLRDGVLGGLSGRLIYQPDELPTAPMAMPHGESTAALQAGRGYLPSIASATAGPTTGAMATDAPSLARWWKGFCAGDVVSPGALAEMSDFVDGYGLGLYNPAEGYAPAIGHTGRDVGFVAWAGCVPAYGAVIVVLANHEVDKLGAMAEPLVLAARAS